MPLYPPVCHSESVMHNSLFDAGRTPVDLRALSEPSPNFTAPTSIHNGESPMVQSSREATASSALPEAGPSRVNLENHASTPSPFIDAMETHCGKNRSSPCHQPGVRYDYDGDIGIGVRPPSLMACHAADHHHEFIANPRFSTADSDGHVDHCSSAVQLPAEPTGINGPATFGDVSSADAGRSALGVVPSLETRGQLSRSVPESIWKSPKTHISQPDTCRPPSGSIRPHSSELAPANLSFPPYGPVTTSDSPDTATTYATLLSHEGESLRHLPLPQPPPEVTALITTWTSGDVVSPVFSRKSPLVPWELPLEIGYFWLGLFKIFDVKVTHARHRQSTNLTSCCGSVSSPGGNASAAKHFKHGFSAMYLALLSRMGAWWRGPTPG
ncbi:hypothetical protein BC826DRAFT_533845 [Russula brevipes]|nr:hypothetical protein BC826DRAFT_533845 [Russula brevipes]